jgi:predicted nucleic acid-binding protein
MGDLMIAATARSVGAAVLTRNPSDFAGLGAIVAVLEVR